MLTTLTRARRRRRARRLYGRFLGSSSLCFDVGANVGERTRMFLQLGCRVVAIEPQPDCADRLRRLESRRALEHARLTVEQVAVGAAPGTAEIRIADVDTMSSLSPLWLDRVQESGRFGEVSWSRSLMVDVTTLDELIGRHGRPDFCKIDVEGYEEQVLAGLSRPLPSLAFEFTPEYAEAAIACVRRLETLGMPWFNFSRGESLLLEWDDWRSAEAVVALLEELRARPDRVRLFGDVYARSPA